MTNKFSNIVELTQCRKSDGFVVHLYMAFCNVDMLNALQASTKNPTDAEIFWRVDD